MPAFRLTFESGIQNIPARDLNRFRQDVNRRLRDVNLNVKIAGGKSAISTINSIKNSTKEAEAVTRTFGGAVGLAARRFAAYTIATGIMVKLSSAIKEAAGNILDFNLEFAKIAQIQNVRIKDVADLRKEVGKLSVELGLSSQKLAGVAKIVAQTGRSGKPLLDILNAIALSSRTATFGELIETTDGVIAALEQFEIQGDRTINILGQINAVTKEYAVESQDIIEAVKRGGSVFASASKGITDAETAFAQFIALFTSVRSTTRESADVIGTSFKTLFARIQRREVIDYLKELGISLSDSEDRFVGPFEAIQKLSRGLNELNIRPGDLRFNEIAEQLGGLRQIGRVIPILTETTKQTDALSIALNGTNSIIEDVPIQLETMAVKVQRVREEIALFFREISDSTSLKVLGTTLLDIASSLTQVARSFSEFIPIISAVGGLKLLQFTSKTVKNIPTGLFNTGGLVNGVGNSDSVPALLTPGEVVLNTKQQKRISQLGLDPADLFKEIGVPGFNTGGIIGRIGLRSGKKTSALDKLDVDSIEVAYKQLGRIADELGLSLEGLIRDIKKQDLKGPGIVRGGFDRRNKDVTITSKANRGTLREELIHAADLNLGGGRRFASEIEGTAQNKIVKEFRLQREKEVQQEARFVKEKDRDKFIKNRLSDREVFSSFVRRQDPKVQGSLLKNTTSIGDNFIPPFRRPSGPNNFDDPDGRRVSRPNNKGRRDFSGPIAGGLLLGGGVAALSVAISSLNDQMEDSSTTSKDYQKNLQDLAIRTAIFFTGLRTISGFLNKQGEPSLFTKGLDKSVEFGKGLKDKIFKDLNTSKSALGVQTKRDDVLEDLNNKESEKLNQKLGSSLTNANKVGDKFNQIFKEIESNQNKIQAIENVRSSALNKKGNIEQSIRDQRSNLPTPKRSSFDLSTPDPIDKKTASLLRERINKLSSKFSGLDGDIDSISKSFGGFEKAGTAIDTYISSLEDLSQKLDKQESIIDTQNQSLQKNKAKSKNFRDGSQLSKKDFVQIELVKRKFPQLAKTLDGFDTETTSGRVALKKYVRSVISAGQSVDIVRNEQKKAAAVRRRLSNKVRDLSSNINFVSRSFLKLKNVIEQKSREIQGSRFGQFIGGTRRGLGKVGQSQSVQNTSNFALASFIAVQTKSLSLQEEAARELKEQAISGGNAQSAYNSALKEASLQQKQSALIAGSAIGAGIGSLFGPLGTALGGLAGAALGASSALNRITDFLIGGRGGFFESQNKDVASQAFQEASRVKFSKSIKDVLDQFNQINKNSGSDAREFLFEKFRNLDKNREGAILDDSLKGIAEPALRAIEQSIDEEISFRINRGQSSDEIFFDLKDEIDDFKGVFSSLGNGSKSAELKIKLWSDQIKAGTTEFKQSIVTRKQEIDAIREVTIALRSSKSAIGRINSIISQQSTNLKSLTVSSESISENRSLASSVNFGKDFDKFETQFENIINRLVDIDPGFDGAANQVLSLNRALLDLPDQINFLQENDSFNLGSSAEQISAILRKSLGDSFGGLSQDQSDTIFKLIGNRIKESGGSIDNIQIDKLIQEIRGINFDPLVKVFKDASSKIGESIENFTKSSNTLANIQRSINDISLNILKAEQNRKDIIGGILNTNDFESVKNNRLSSASNILKGIDVDLDLKSIGSSLNKVNKLIVQEVKLRDLFVKQGNDIAINKSTQTINDLTIKAEKLTKALGVLGDTSKESAFLQKKLSDEQSKRSKLRDVAADFTFGTRESRRDTILNKKLADLVARTNNPDVIPEDRRGSVLSLLREFKDLPIFAGRTGEEVIKNTLQRFLISQGAPIDQVNKLVANFTTTESDLLSSLDSSLIVQEQQLQILKDIKNSSIAGFQSGGSVKFNNNKVFNPKGTDSVPAMLTPGEFVVNAKATKANRELLERINNGQVDFKQSGGIIRSLKNRYGQKFEDQGGTGAAFVDSQYKNLVDYLEGNNPFNQPLFSGVNTSSNGRIKNFVFNKGLFKIINNSGLNDLKSLNRNIFDKISLTQGLINSGFGEFINEETKGQFNNDLNKTSTHLRNIVNVSSRRVNRLQRIEDKRSKLLKAKQEQKAKDFQDFGHLFKKESKLGPSSIKKVKKFQNGGLVDGIGGIDKNLALLTKGEFVINADAVKNVGLDKLNQINNNKLPKFQNGGPVGETHQFASLDRFNSSIDSLSKPIPSLDRFSDSIDKLVGYTMRVELAPTQHTINLQGAEVLASIQPEIQNQIRIQMSEAILGIKQQIKFGSI